TETKSHQIGLRASGNVTGAPEIGHSRSVPPSVAIKRSLNMLASQRALFEMPRHICYLNAASYSPLPLKTMEAGRAAIGRKGTPWTLAPGFANDQHERARAAAARLIDADPTDMALIPSIRYGVAHEAMMLTIDSV